MPKSKGGHLTKGNRKVIEAGLRDGVSCRGIAAMIDASPSTVSREVRANRTVVEKKRRPGANPAVRCARYRDCKKAGAACEGCSTKATACKRCKTHACIDACADYDRRMCPATVSWPYVCAPACRQRACCGFPKCSYDAEEADEASRRRLRESREGAALTADELVRMDVFCFNVN